MTEKTRQDYMAFLTSHGMTKVDALVALELDERVNRELIADALAAKPIPEPRRYKSSSPQNGEPGGDTEPDSQPTENDTMSDAGTVATTDGIIRTHHGRVRPIEHYLSSLNKNETVTPTPTMPDRMWACISDKDPTKSNWPSGRWYSVKQLTPVPQVEYIRANSVPVADPGLRERIEKALSIGWITEKSIRIAMLPEVKK